MKRKIALLFAFIIVAVGCSEDEGNTATDLTPVQPVEVLPALTTQNPVFEGGGIKFNGTVVTEGIGYYERGFCWSYNTNPVVSNEKTTVDGSGTGPFFAYIPYVGSLQPNTTLNVRSYVIAMNGEAVYGNNITFTTPAEYDVTLNTVTDITTGTAKLSGGITANNGSVFIQNRGFCVSTNATPTLANSEVVTASGTALGNYTGEVTNLTANTTYYVRAFGYNTTSQVHYSSTVTFKTTGYIGASGGYVYYDKGYVSDGWRYLEAAPADITYNGSIIMRWGCTGTSVFQTNREVGTGKQNTDRILQVCNDANSAAKVCADYSVNGLDDWFLPSLDEMGLLDSSLSSLINLGDNNNQTYWTSTEYDGSTARAYNGYYGFAPGFGVSKNNNNRVRPVRRY